MPLEDRPIQQLQLLGLECVEHQLEASTGRPNDGHAKRYYGARPLQMLGWLSFAANLLTNHLHTLPIQTGSHLSLYREGVIHVVERRLAERIMLAFASSY